MKNDNPNYKSVLTTELIPYARNSRTHSEAQVSKIASSIKEFGFLNPVLIDLDNGIIAGHGRVMAAQKLGLKEVPVLQIGHLSDTQKRAYIIADNRLALDAGWDEEMLRVEFAELADNGFNFTINPIPKCHPKPTCKSTLINRYIVCCYCTSCSIKFTCNINTHSSLVNNNGIYLTINTTV